MSCPAPPGAKATSFDAFAGWDGSCTTVNAIPAGKLCNGSACVQSLSIAPLVLNETACVSHLEPVVVPKNSTVPWGTLARVCRGHAPGECGDPRELCTPAATATNDAPTSDSFAQCVSRDGDVTCSGAYTVKHVFYRSFVDNRTCAPCACDAPTGSTCTATINVFEDGACKTPLLSAQIDATETACYPIFPVGSALGSKSVDTPVYAPGACQASGGDTMGEATPTDATTFCCLP
jgi:hypothetical protein